MKKSAIVVLVLGLAAVLAFVDTSRTQELDRLGPGLGADTSRTQQLDRSGRGPGANNPLAADKARREGRLPAELGVSEGDAIGTIVGQLGEAPDAEKAALMKKLEAAVSNQFERDMERRESELTKLEERFRKLRQQLDRRRKAKTEIIELQIKVLVNEAEGLGFGEDSSASESWYKANRSGGLGGSMRSPGPPGAGP